MADLTPVALSAMHHKHLELGASLIESDGWKRPSRYTTPEDEAERLKQGIGVCDISPVGKLSVQGDDIESLLKSAFPKGDVVERLRVQRRRIGRGSSAQEIGLARLADDELLVLTRPGEAATVAERFADKPVECARTVDVSSGLAAVSTVGPRSRELLARLTELDAREESFPDMSCAQVKLAEIYAIVLRRDVGGLLGYELYFEREYGEYIWDALFHAEDLGVVPFGVEALELLR